MARQPASRRVELGRQVDQDRGQPPQHRIAVDEGWHLTTRINGAITFVHLVAPARPETDFYLFISNLEERHQEPALYALPDVSRP
jgi:hypothetical protein